MTPEGKILAECLSWLSVQPGVRVWRNASGRRGKYLLGRVGQADITGVCAPRGRRIEIEIKDKGKEPSDAQKAFLSEIQALGGIAFYADSIDMLQENWRQQL